MEAVAAAVRDGVTAVNLGGGFHHALRDRGHGFCVFNDVAVAARVLLAEGLIGRALVIDLDVHQGDGTADILEGDARVHTLALLGRNSYQVR